VAVVVKFVILISVSDAVTVVVVGRGITIGNEVERGSTIDNEGVLKALGVGRDSRTVTEGMSLIALRTVIIELGDREDKD
jgi:hypothetical protein